LGYAAQVPTAGGSNQVVVGNTSITYAGIQVAWTITSDRRLKNAIQPSPLGLDFITRLKPVSYIRSSDTGKKVEYGFIAQEVEETLLAFGAANTGMIAKDDQGMYGVRYNDLLSPLVKALQELNTKLEAENAKLKTEQTGLQKDVHALKTELEKLNQRMDLEEKK
ncbi:MAG TPA: tail fiber domain-containing protein, partial [Bacteroidia bacterium]|nr:tail fiber domain-containing protein [Bacteroidia bacterium]